jgi:ABC-type multidrug transport system fused ATPase/permease subunit
VVTFQARASMPAIPLTILACHQLYRFVIAAISPIGGESHVILLPDRGVAILAAVVGSASAMALVGLIAGSRRLVAFAAFALAGASIMRLALWWPLWQDGIASVERIVDILLTAWALSAAALWVFAPLGGHPSGEETGQ